MPTPNIGLRTSTKPAALARSPRRVDSKNVTAYGYSMTKREKFLAKARNNPRGLSFDEFRTLLSQAGWEFEHQTGSHEVWYSPLGYRLSIQNRAGMAKGYQVQQFLNQHEVENGKG